MSGYKDYLSNEMQGDMETSMKPKRTRLSQFRHGGYHSSMEEFFTAGKKSYGVKNVDVAQLGKYSNTGRGGNPRFSITEFFGKTFMSNGGEVTVYNNPANIETGQGFAGETGNTYANNRKNGKKPFVIFDSPEMGVRALAMDLQTKIKRHEGDVDKIIAQFAPDNENDTKKYQEFVKQKLKKDKVTNKDLKFLVQAIIEKENKPEVAAYYLENPDVIKKGLAMSYFQLPKGISLEQAMNEISAKEATLKKVLKKKPQMNEGGSVKKQMAKVLNEDAPEGERLAYINPQEERMLRNAGGSGELTESGIPSYRGHHGGGGTSSGSSSSSSGGDSDKGGNKSTGTGGMTPGPAAGGQMTAGATPGATSATGGTTQGFGGFKGDSNKGGGADASQPDFSGPTPSQDDTKNNTQGPSNPNLRKGTVNTSTKKAVKKANSILDSTNLFSTSFNTFSNVDIFGQPVKSAIDAYNQGIVSGIMGNVYGQVLGQPGYASLGVQTSLSPENVRDANFTGTETDVVGSLGTNIGGYNVGLNANFGEDTGSVSVDRDFGFTIGNRPVNVNLGVSMDEQGNVSPQVGFNFKKGGLLDRSRKNS